MALTKTKKKDHAWRDRLVEQIRECVDAYPSVYIFAVENMKNVTFKALKDQWGGSRFFMAKNTVMATVLGRDAESELKENFHTFVRYLHGGCGLLFTSSAHEDVLSFFEGFEEEHFARAGCTATEDFLLETGELPTELCPHPMEPQLRKLGLKTRLNKGKIELLNDTMICKKGDILTAEQCRLLQIFEKKMAVFRINLIAHWQDGKVEVLAEHEGVDDKSDMEADNDDLSDRLITQEELDNGFQWGEIAVPSIK